jgi:hypothetical protein
VTTRIDRTALLALLGGRHELLEQLVDEGFLPRDDTALNPAHAEIARVVYTLSEELDVNWAGVEVILRLRSQLIATRQQVGQLLDLLRTDRETR